MTSTRSLDVRAKDLMHKDVVRLEADATIDSAVATLEEHGISGAPVVDSTERLIGVFSVRDIARSEHLRAGRLGEREGDDRVPDWADEDTDEGFLMGDEISDRDDYSSAAGGGNTVSDWMNPTIIAVAPEAPLRDVCKAMAGERIHRVFVVDGKRLIGVISSFDVVQHLARTL